MPQGIVGNHGSNSDLGVNISVAYSDKAQYHAAAKVMQHGPAARSRRGPLIAGKQNADMFPSLERSNKNQSELSLLKLPEIGAQNIN